MILLLAVALAMQPAATPPSLLSKVEPTYTDEARAAGVADATVVIQLVVNTDGKPENIRVVRKVGYGLDERAVEAVGKWRFKPGMSGGKPVPVVTTVEVNFGLLSPRKAYEVAARQLESSNKAEALAALRAMADLAALRFGPALYSLAMVYREGKLVEADSARFEILMDSAAEARSDEALFFRGNQFEKGQGRPRDAVKARRYFQQCASVSGHPICWFRLANVMQDSTSGPVTSVEILAFYELALEAGVAEAKPRADQLAAALSAGDRPKVDKLKAKILEPLRSRVPPTR